MQYLRVLKSCYVSPFFRFEELRCFFASHHATIFTWSDVTTKPRLIATRMKPNINSKLKFLRKKQNGKFIK